ncbi:MAG: discoidin domain-containing protein [Parabacteroides merdae]
MTPGEYMLPIRLDNVSLFNIAENAARPLVVLGCRNQGGSCGLEYTSQYGRTDRRRVPETVWRHVCWMGNYRLSGISQKWSGGSIPLPHEIVVDMKKETTLTNISLTERQHDSYRDVKGGEFFVSSDKLCLDGSRCILVAQKVLGRANLQHHTRAKGRYY